MPWPHLQTLNSKSDSWEPPCSGLALGWWLEKGLCDVPYCPTYPSYPRNHCHLLGQFFWFFLRLFHYFPVKDVKRESGRAELVFTLRSRWGSLSAWSRVWGCGNGAVAATTEASFCEANWGGWGKAAFLLHPWPLVPSFFKTDVLHPSQSVGQPWELKMQSPSPGN